MFLTGLFAGQGLHADPPFRSDGADTAQEDQEIEDWLRDITPEDIARAEALAHELDPFVYKQETREAFEPDYMDIYHFLLARGHDIQEHPPRSDPYFRVWMKYFRAWLDKSSHELLYVTRNGRPAVFRKGQVNIFTEIEDAHVKQSNLPDGSLKFRTKQNDSPIEPMKLSPVPETERHYLIFSDFDKTPATAKRAALSTSFLVLPAAFVHLVGESLPTFPINLSRKEENSDDPQLRIDPDRSAFLTSGQLFFAEHARPDVPDTPGLHLYFSDQNTETHLPLDFIDLFKLTQVYSLLYHARLAATSPLETDRLLGTIAEIPELTQAREERMLQEYMKKYPQLKKLVEDEFDRLHERVFKTDAAKLHGTTHEGIFSMITRQFGRALNFKTKQEAIKFQLEAIRRDIQIKEIEESISKEEIDSLQNYAKFLENQRNWRTLSILILMKVFSPIGPTVKFSANIGLHILKFANRLARYLVAKPIRFVSGPLPNFISRLVPGIKKTRFSGIPENVTMTLLFLSGALTFAHSKIDPSHYSTMVDQITSMTVLMASGFVLLWVYNQAANYVLTGAKDLRLTDPSADAQDQIEAELLEDLKNQDYKDRVLEILKGPQPSRWLYNIAGRLIEKDSNGNRSIRGTIGAGALSAVALPFSVATSPFVLRKLAKLKKEGKADEKEKEALQLELIQEKRRRYEVARQALAKINRTEVKTYGAFLATSGVDTVHRRRTFPFSRYTVPIVFPLFFKNMENGAWGTREEGTLLTPFDHLAEIKKPAEERKKRKEAREKTIQRNRIAHRSIMAATRSFQRDIALTLGATKTEIISITGRFGKLDRFIAYTKLSLSKEKRKHLRRFVQASSALAEDKKLAELTYAWMANNLPDDTSEEAKQILTTNFVMDEVASLLLQREFILGRSKIHKRLGLRLKEYLRYQKHDFVRRKLVRYGNDARYTNASGSESENMARGAIALRDEALKKLFSVTLMAGNAYGPGDSMSDALIGMFQDIGINTVHALVSSVTGHGPAIDEIIKELEEHPEHADFIKDYIHNILNRVHYNRALIQTGYWIDETRNSYFYTAAVVALSAFTLDLYNYYSNNFEAVGFGEGELPDDPIAAMAHQRAIHGVALMFTNFVLSLPFTYLHKLVMAARRASGYTSPVVFARDEKGHLIHDPETGQPLIDKEKTNRRKADDQLLWIEYIFGMAFMYSGSFFHVFDFFENMIAGDKDFPADSRVLLDQLKEKVGDFHAIENYPFNGDAAASCPDGLSELGKKAA